MECLCFICLIKTKASRAAQGAQPSGAGTLHKAIPRGSPAAERDHGAAGSRAFPAAGPPWRTRPRRGPSSGPSGVAPWAKPLPCGPFLAAEGPRAPDEPRPSVPRAAWPSGRPFFPAEDVTPSSSSSSSSSSPPPPPPPRGPGLRRLARKDAHSARESATVSASREEAAAAAPEISPARPEVPHAEAAAGPLLSLSILSVFLRNAAAPEPCGSTVGPSRAVLPAPAAVFCLTELVVDLIFIFF
ncbi:predicted GPI-anchored protein 58 [Motacilla alba alba]|uniref:predicted GPI-anchored protein 58 n=1 Tax=Motacilla alba alba TaxID=1094192 RepID=UPI0018D56DD1|nr:predicted GPI-anchored protein 58 [Motacilla alba alba]